MRRAESGDKDLILLLARGDLLTDLLTIGILGVIIGLYVLANFGERSRTPRLLTLIAGGGLAGIALLIGAAVCALNLLLFQTGAEDLLKTIEAGKASARLLQDRTVAARLQESRPPQLDKRIAKLTSGLPPAEQRIDDQFIAFAELRGAAPHGPRLHAGPRLGGGGTAAAGPLPEPGSAGAGISAVPGSYKENTGGPHRGGCGCTAVQRRNQWGLGHNPDGGNY